MALPLPKDRLRALSEERRRFQRVRVDLLGRYMLPDRREFPCQVVNMSPGGMALIAPVAGQPGERVIAYVDHLGRLEGHVARIIQNGFAMTISATPRKRDKLAAQLTWLANRHILGLPEDRRHGRVVPRNPIARSDPAERHQCQLPDHRRVAIGRRHRKRPAAADRRAGHARQGAGPRRAASRRRLRRSSSPGCSIRTFLKTPSALRKQHRLTPPGNSPPAARGSRAARPAARARNP